MFKLPNPPSPQANPHELADFAELLCWLRSSASAREIVALLGRLNDNDHNIGCDDDDDDNAALLDEVMNEIERRQHACGDGYPFRLEKAGTVIRMAKTSWHSMSARSIVYLYLLLSTRLKMNDHRIQAGIDGTALLETLSAHVLMNYLGVSRARTMVFGTSSQGSFSDKVNELCVSLGEGSCFTKRDEAPVRVNDDKLDTVGWIPFSDRLPGQLIVFGQCKTGTNTRDSMTQLQPENFVKKWLHEPLLVTPLRAFFISEAADRARWKGDCVAAGILFDRCRLVDFCDQDPDNIDEVAAWTLAARRTAEDMINGRY